MVSLLYLKNSFNLSDEDLVQRWAENVQWQFFGGMDYNEPRLPCDATRIGRFRRILGERARSGATAEVHDSCRRSKSRPSSPPSWSA